MNFLRFLFSRKFLKHLLLAIAITLILIWITLQGLAWYTKHNDYIIVPDFRGRYLQEVVGDPDHRNYQFSVIDSVFDTERPGGTVMTQDPFPGARVKKNRMVYLTITSIVPEKTAMPDLKDLTLRQAQTMLESAGLKLGKLIYVRSFDEDAVQNQYFEGNPIRAGTLIDKGSSITLMVGMGARAQERTEEEASPDSIY
jgi:beta-lactam-binding protein with PASTA domain